MIKSIESQLLQFGSHEFEKRSPLTIRPSGRSHTVDCPPRRIAALPSLMIRPIPPVEKSMTSSLQITIRIEMKSLVIFPIRFAPPVR